MFLRSHKRPAIAAGLLGLYVVATTALPLAHNAHHERAHGHAHATPHAAAPTPHLAHSLAHGPAAHHGRHAHDARSARTVETSPAHAIPRAALFPLHTPDLTHADGRVEHFGAATLAATPLTVAPRTHVVSTRAAPRVCPTPQGGRYPAAQPRAPPTV